MTCIELHLQLVQVCQIEDGISSDLAKDGMLAVKLLCGVQCVFGLLNTILP